MATAKDSLIPAAELAGTRRAVFPGESPAYSRARETLLTEEIELRRRHLARVAEQRRALPPGPLIEKNYRFVDANGVETGLIDLFGEHDTLITYFTGCMGHNAPDPVRCARISLAP